jgi:hypothetical protein
LVLSDGDILDVTNSAEVVDASARQGVLVVPYEPRGSVVPYNLRSASRPPVPTILGGLAVVSSMTRIK